MTSIEWLETELKKIPFVNPKEKFEQAKEMHKKEIIDAHLDGQSLVSCKDEYAEQYYQETFGSKGSATSDFDKPFMDFAKQYVEQLKTKKN